jgi:teichoic acid transport system permease protein
VPENLTQKQQAVTRVHRPFKAGLPNLIEYSKDMWTRRELAYELARAQLRAQQSTTLFGQLWLVLNPLIQAGIYYLLVIILSTSHKHGPDFVAHLLAGMFAYHTITSAMGMGAASVVSLGKLIANRSFPRLLLPFSAGLVAMKRFWPTLIIYTIYWTVFVHADELGYDKFGWNMLWAIPAILLLAIFVFGLAALLATLQVYFRDMRSFLPFISRIGLYVSPILWVPEDVKGQAFAVIENYNPVYGLLCIFEAAVANKPPTPAYWYSALAWTAAIFISGVLIFVSREREFSVRI